MEQAFVYQAGEIFCNYTLKNFITLTSSEDLCTEENKTDQYTVFIYSLVSPPPP